MQHAPEQRVRDRQDPLCLHYRTRSDAAWIRDRAHTSGGTNYDPFHGNVTAGGERQAATIPFGIHQAVGGYHDLPNPGDLLCAALASCLDSTLRIVAERLGVTLTHLQVAVSAEVDVRGTLLVDRSVPVPFQRMRCNVALAVAEGTPTALLHKLYAAAEHSCVNLQTLQRGIAVQTTWQLTQDAVA